MKCVALHCASILVVAVAASAPAAAAPPAYMKADRAGVEKAFGKAITGNIFSDKLTANRKKFIATSLQTNAAPGCPRNPPFTLVAIAPLFANDKDGTAWEERFEIACKPAVRRNLLFTVTRKAGVQMIESVAGDSIAPVKVRNEFLPKLLETVSSPECKKVRVLDSRVATPPEKGGAPWTEAWTLDVCDTKREVGVELAPGEGDAFTWKFTIQ